MISEVDIQDMEPNYDLTPEEIIQDDKAFWLNLELEALSVEMGWGRLSPDCNKRFYD
jgi:hypothetical protein